MAGPDLSHPNSIQLGMENAQQRIELAELKADMRELATILKGMKEITNLPPAASIGEAWQQYVAVSQTRLRAVCWLLTDLCTAIEGGPSVGAIYRQDVKAKIEELRAAPLGYEVFKPEQVATEAGENAE